MNSEIGTLVVIAENGDGELAKFVHDTTGTVDVVSLSGEVSFGKFSDLKVMSVFKKGAAVRRLIDAGKVKVGRENYVPAAWLVSAAKSVTTLDKFLESRLAWMVKSGADQKQIDATTALYNEVVAVMAQESALNN